MDSPMDIDLLKSQLAGIIEKGKLLRTDEAKFLKAQGLEEECEKAKQEVIDQEAELEKLKAQLSGFVEAKNNAVGKSIQSITEKMAEVLPEGMPVFELTEEGLIIGWEYDGRYRPYEGLSGGEKVQFDLAMAHVLKAGVLIMEAAEVDNKSLIETMGMLSQVDKQIIISTCHAPDVISDGWLHIDLG
jgi:cell division septum initiation protein DivIVA